jgi:hypothetical protein
MVYLLSGKSKKKKEIKIDAVDFFFSMNTSETDYFYEYVYGIRNSIIKTKYDY